MSHISYTVNYSWYIVNFTIFVIFIIISSSFLKVMFVWWGSPCWSMVIYCCLFSFWRSCSGHVVVAVENHWTDFITFDITVMLLGAMIYKF